MKEKQGQTGKITEVKKTEEEKDFKGAGVEGTKAEQSISELEELLKEKDARIAELEKKVSELSPKTTTNVVKGEDVIKSLRSKGVKI